MKNRDERQADDVKKVKPDPAWDRASRFKYTCCYL